MGKDAVVQWMAKRIDRVASRASRNGFQVVNMKMRPPTTFDGLFHRISFFNHCCASQNNATWVYDGSTCLLNVKTTRDVAAGEELTISYIQKPWCDLAKHARQQYLKQNFGFECLCKACTSVVESVKATEKPRDLGQLISLWMKGDASEDADATRKSLEKASTPARDRASAKPALTDEERIERVLKRCHGEGLAVNAEDAGK